MRQVRQLAIALARAMNLRQDGRILEATEVLEASMSEVGLPDLSRLLSMSRADLLDVLQEPDGWSMEGASSIADALFEYAVLGGGQDEDRAGAARERALWLYEECLRSGQTVPLHIHERLAAAEQTKSRAATTDPPES